MRRVFFASRFEKKLKTFNSKHPEFSTELEAVIIAIAIDAHAPSLKVHRLHGQLRNCFAARITHQYRIVFVLDFDRVTFIDIGTHDDVYR
jgi:addiction module RelE/StbE family toxin